MYKQAPKQAYFELFKFMGWCFFSHLVLRFTNRHQTNLVLVIYVYGVVLLLASCTLMYKQAPNEPIYSCLCLRGGALSRIMYFGAQAGTKNKPIFSCLSLWDGAIVYISNARLQFFF